VVAVANRSLESSQRVADKFDIPRAYDDWREVVSDEDVDAICIGTWPNLHCDVARSALVAGKHVLCEARMAMNVPQARSMVEAASQSHVVAMLVPSPFGLKGDQVMRRLVADGFLGEVREIYVRGLAATLADETAPLHWRQRADLSGVNLLVLGILNETIQRWFGQAASVLAQTALFIPRRTCPDTGQLQDVDIPDSVVVAARMASGAQCVYHVSGVAHHAGAMRIEAFGSGGTLTYDLANDVILGAKAGEAELKSIEIPSEEAGRWQVEEDFVAAIREHRPVTLTSFIDGLRYMQFTEAVRRSADTGCRVSVAGL